MFLKKTIGDDEFIPNALSADGDKIRAWKLVDEFILKAFALAKRLPQEEQHGLCWQIKRAAALCGASTAEWASKGKSDSDEAEIGHFHSLLTHLRYYIYLARRLNFIEQKEYLLAIRKHEAAARIVADILAQNKNRQ